MATKDASISADTAASAKIGNFPLLLTVSLVSSVIMLDSNIVAVSLPTMGRELHASFRDIQWVISSYVLVFCSLLMATGMFADLHGRKKAMAMGLVIFAIGSLGCGLATTSLMLNLSRAAQGLGGAFLVTSSMAFLGHDFAGPVRTQAVAFWGGAIGIALALGPIAGGAITNALGWRSIFLLNLPIAAVLLWMTFAFTKESRDPDAKSLDWGGILTFSGALAFFIWGLIDGNDVGWTSTSVLGRIGIALVLLVVFLMIEARQKRPMMDLSLFKLKTFQGAEIAMLGYGASVQVMIFFLPQFLQNAYGFSPLMAGVAMLPFAMPMVLAPRLTTMLSNQFSGKLLLTIGLAISFIGNLSFWFVAKAGQPYTIFVISMLIAGCGAGLLNGLTVRVLQAAVPGDRAGMASGFASTTRFLGILVSVAALGAVLQSTVRTMFVDLVSSIDMPRAQAIDAARHITAGDLTYAEGLMPAALHETIRHDGMIAFGFGFGQAAMLAAVICGIACVLTYWRVQESDTAAPKTTPAPKVPCAVVDCRTPV